MKESQVSRTRRKLESWGQWEKMCRNNVYNRDLGSGKVMVIHRTFLKIPGHRQNGALQSFKWRDVSRSTRIGKIVKVLGIDIIIHVYHETSFSVNERYLDEHPDNFEGVLHWNRCRSLS